MTDAEVLAVSGAVAALRRLFPSGVINRHQIRNLGRIWEAHPSLHSDATPAFMCHSEGVEAILAAPHGYVDMAERARTKHQERYHAGDVNGRDDCEGCGFFDASVYEAKTGRQMANDMRESSDNGPTH
jgi:hypothetical protein